MRAVPRIDDDGRDRLGSVGSRALCFMPHDNGIHAHRLDRIKRIAQALPLHDARCARRDVHHIGAQILSRQFK